MKVNPYVFFISAAIILVFVALGMSLPETMNEVFSSVKDGIVDYFGWFYIISVGFFLIFCLWLMLSRYGHLKLGKEDDEPDYSYGTWFAMLFSAGMGIGLLFWSVAEPVYHYASPPRSTEYVNTQGIAILAEGDPELETAAVHAEEGAAAETAGEPVEEVAEDPVLTPAQKYANARTAMNITFFHWGIHAWAIYIVIGLSMAFFAYRHGLPLTIRSTLWPIFGDRIYGAIGNTVDIFAVFGTLFGVATSLGLGVMQINSGLSYLGILSESTANQVWLIIGITIVATISVVSGLDIGIRRLSEMNLVLGLILLLFVFIAGPTVFLLSSFVQSLGLYVSSLVEMTFRTNAFIGTAWQKSWTMFYWGWWISWSPFVGMFVARISKGRTIREFIVGVLFVPALLAFFWLVVFGNTALWMEITGDHAVAATILDEGNVPAALFVMLQHLPWSTITCLLATIVIATYFVTSSDSASLVIDILTSGGAPNPPVAQRIFWALTEGAVAIALLVAGGTQSLDALQAAAIATALPFCAIMLVICWSLVRGLRAERHIENLPPIPKEVADEIVQVGHERAQEREAAEAAK